MKRTHLLNMGGFKPMKERLEELITVLRTVPHENLNMNFWGINYTCGFAGCALGHAAIHPPFMELGLELYFDSEESSEVRYKGHANYEAACEFFGITVDDALFIFDPAQYDRLAPSAVEVIGHIREVVEQDSVITEISTMKRKTK
jgi:hypothetical protein